MLSSALSRRALSSHVPDEFRTDWALAQSEVFSVLLDGFAQWRASGDRSALDRGLKWHLALSAILLRGRRRGGRRGDVAVALRFGHWRAGRRDLLVRMWLDDRGRSAEYRRLRVESSSPDPAITIERVLEHIDDGELSLGISAAPSAAQSQTIASRSTVTTIQTQRHTRTTTRRPKPPGRLNSRKKSRRPGADHSPRLTQKRPPPANPTLPPPAPRAPPRACSKAVGEMEARAADA